MSLQVVGSFSIVAASGPGPRFVSRFNSQFISELRLLGTKSWIGESLTSRRAHGHACSAAEADGASAVRSVGIGGQARSSSTMADVVTKPRGVARVFLNKEQAEGAGARVRRSIGRPDLNQLDPFLLLDFAETFVPLDATVPTFGFPSHPHRGFETVSYMIEGSFQHQDFAGHEGLLHPGDVQWMTAGRGIVHSEMPASRGKGRGVQLWVNLPAKDKMIEPQYQELQAKDIPNVEKNGVKVAIIAGESFGVKSPVFTRTPTLYLDFTLQPGAAIQQAIPEGWNALAYILDGESTFGSSDSKPVAAHHTILFGAGDGLNVWNKSEKGCRFLLIAGQPLNEPVARHGPFVMNTQAELQQAVRDYQTARNGFEKIRTWKEKPTILV